MKKLVDGIIEFRKSILPKSRAKFEELAKGQSPDTMFITCSDSRVAPNWFASTNPGDLFVIRNVGNLIPCCEEGAVNQDDSVLAAVEFAVLNLKVADIIICGHSECGAMVAIAEDRNLDQTPHLKSWIRNGEESLRKLVNNGGLDSTLSRVNQLSQMNVLQQIENLKAYPLIRSRVHDGKLRIHGWWFDIAKADVYQYDASAKKFTLIA